MCIKRFNLYVSITRVCLAEDYKVDPIEKTRMMEETKGEANRLTADTKFLTKLFNRENTPKVSFSSFPSVLFPMFLLEQSGEMPPM